MKVSAEHEEACNVDTHFERVAAGQRHGFLTWIRSHPWLSAALISCLAAIMVAVAVAIPICIVSGCPPGSTGLHQEGLSIGSPRLLLNYLNHSVFALDLIPPLLREYITSLMLNTSNIQILNFETESILQEALKYLRGDSSLNFLTRDFSMSSPLPDGTVDRLLSLVANDATLQDIINRLKEAAGDAWAAVIPPINDPFYLNGSQYYVDLINATGAWQYRTGSPIVVAVIDVGVDLDHPDLKANLWVNSGEIPGNGIDDDGNGYIDDVYGYSFAGKCSGVDASTGQCNACTGTSMPYADSNVNSAYYHGTHAAGLIGAVQDNFLGMTGIAPGVKLMILRVSDCMTGSIQASSVFQAFDYALRMSAHIVSCSFGAPYAVGFSPSVRAPSYHSQWTAAYVSALQPLASKGVLAVVSAGNEGIDMDLLSSLGYSYAPCLVSLPNVLCVGGTDADDSRASFSNYGSNTVHLGAPAVQIYSTLYRNDTVVSHTYGPLNGTSMAAPLVSGSAALTLSLLGAADGNYYKAEQVRSLLMSSGHRPPSGPLPWASQARLSAGASMLLAASQLGAALVKLSPVYSSASPPPASLAFQGLVESYYVASDGQFSNAVLGIPFDVSLREISSPANPANLTSFKYNAGVIVTYAALLQLSQTGVWGVQVQTAASSLSTWVYINGLQVPINATTQRGLFMANAKGLYDFELRIAYPMPNVRYSLLFQPPSAPSFSSYYGFVAHGPSVFKMPDFAQDAKLSSLWQVFYNKVNTTSQPIRFSTVATSTPTSQYQYTTAVSDPGAGKLGALLFPGDAAISTTTAAVGFMQTFLIPTAGAWPSTIAFNVHCAGCQLLVDGRVVVDVFEPIVSGTAITKTSPCITLTSNEAHELTLRFAVGSLSDATLSVEYTSCGVGSVASGSTSMSGVVYNPLVWQPESSANAGNAAFIGGLQCDVYRNSTGNLTLGFSAQQMRPVYKVRLPVCKEETIYATCNTTWNFTLEDLLPGLGAGSPGGSTFGVRCWTTWCRGFSTGAMSVSPASSQPVAFLGGLKVYGSGATALAPNMTLLGDMYQLLAVDWFNITAATPLSVVDNGVPVKIDLISMRLPIGGLASPSGLSWMKGTRVVGSRGAYTSTAYTPQGDVSALVLNDLTQAYVQMGMPLPSTSSGSFGMNTVYQYANVLGSQVHYTQAEGYLTLMDPVAAPGPITIQVADGEASATTLVMGNVTLLNAPAFSHTSTSKASSFQVYCSRNISLYVNVICKALTPDGSTSFNIITVAAEGPWGPAQWARTSNAPVQ